MIDVLTEDLISLRDVCREPAMRNNLTRKPAHISQAYRWIQIGAKSVSGKRIQLETVKTPSGLRTSRQAIARFIAALSESPKQPAVNPDRAQADADKYLDGVGV
jgi:hypothetical protein